MISAYEGYGYYDLYCTLDIFNDEIGIANQLNEDLSIHDGLSIGIDTHDYLYFDLEFGKSVKIVLSDISENCDFDLTLFNSTDETEDDVVARSWYWSNRNEVIEFTASEVTILISHIMRDWGLTNSISHSFEGAYHSGSCSYPQKYGGG